ncbi:MAG: uracil/xanthine transporter [Bacillaceae bacterium G1]|nr:uracil/xanthine transporter [Bacillota bacterium]OJF16957.1 MAG: uracil/xanthine transporter [Bacillaceae bacterium G1]
MGGRWVPADSLAGLQWLLFQFTNIVVIPITVGAAFGLEQEKTLALLQLSFVVTGLACVAQAVFGHGRAIMEGQSGLWWGVVLALFISAAAQGVPAATAGGSLAVGVMASGLLLALIGLSGLGERLARLFNPAVMGVFTFLLGCQLSGIFLKGMMGIPFGMTETPAAIQLPVALCSIGVVVAVLVFSFKAPPAWRRYGLLFGIAVGWPVYALLFPSEPAGELSAFQIYWFPFGPPAWDVGIILTAVMAGLLNMANTFGALKGTEPLYGQPTTKSQYRRSFAVTGAVNVLSGMLGLVPYAPYVSTIGFLRQTGVLHRRPFVLGSLMFTAMGLIPWFGRLFLHLPLSVGSAVLFVAYLPLVLSALDFFRQLPWDATNIYRIAIPLFAGIVIMTLPAEAFASFPSWIRPLVSNGLLMGILLSLLLENGRRFFLTTFRENDYH